MIGKAVKLVAKAVAGSAWAGQMGVVAALSTAETLLTLLSVGLVKDVSAVKQAMLDTVVAAGKKAQAEARIEVAKAVEAENKVVLLRRAAIERQREMEHRAGGRGRGQRVVPPTFRRGQEVRLLLEKRVTFSQSGSALPPVASFKADETTLPEPAASAPQAENAEPDEVDLSQLDAGEIAAALDGIMKTTDDSTSTPEARSRRVTEARLKLEMALHDLIAKGGSVAIDAPELVTFLRLLGVSIKSEKHPG